MASSVASLTFIVSNSCRKFAMCRLGPPTNFSQIDLARLVEEVKALFQNCWLEWVGEQY